MLKHFIGLFLLLILSTNLAAAYCVPNVISYVSDDGATIVFMSEEMWRVDPGDRQEAKHWLPSDEVYLCDRDHIIHLDDGEEVTAKRVR